MRSRLLVAWAVLGLLVTPSVASADEILIYAKFDTIPAEESGNPAAGEAQEVLEGLGHSVTVVASLTPMLPADLSVFDSIWVIQLPPISGPDQVKLRDFVKAGGGLYLTGEREGCCGALNDSMDSLTSGLLVPPTAHFAGANMEGGALMLPSAADPFGITSTPNVITQWETLGAGVISYSPPERVVFANASSLVGAVAFVGEDMEQAAGCLYVAMDLSFWLDIVAPDQDLAPLAENLEHFLVTCGDSDSDGLSDSGEEGFGTDPDDPDSDHDGLCDGYGSVPGKCISGESPFFEFDEDGIINPLDDDDDGDGIPTLFELGAEGLAPNIDDDNIPAYYDLDSDGNFILDGEEGPGDYDDDGIPAIVDDGDEPLECQKDADCGAGSDLHCNQDVGYCHPLVPVVIGGGEGGAGQGGARGGVGEGQAGEGDPGSSSQGGTGDDAKGGDANAGGATDDSAGGAKDDSARARDDAGCNCRTTGTNDTRGPFSVALLALLSLLRRRRSWRDG